MLAAPERMDLSQTRGPGRAWDSHVRPLEGSSGFSALPWEMKAHVLSPKSWV